MSFPYLLLFANIPRKHLILRKKQARWKTELRSSDQEASPSEGKNTGIVLKPCSAWKCVPTAISGAVDISEDPGCHLLQQMSSQ